MTLYSPDNRSPKVRATLYLSPEILDEARNAAFHLAGYPARLTLTKLAENALPHGTYTVEARVQPRRGISATRRRAAWRPTDRRIKRVITPENTTSRTYVNPSHA